MAPSYNLDGSWGIWPDKEDIEEHSSFNDTYRALNSRNPEMLASLEYSIKQEEERNKIIDMPQ